MNKAKTNLVIDVLLLLDMAAVAGIGLLMRYVLVPGYQRRAIYGRNVELLLWGMNRHEWGTLHFALSAALAGLLVLHVVLHWGVIVSIFRQMVGPGTMRVIAALALLAATVVLVVGPLLLRPKVLDSGGGQGGGRGRGRGGGPGRGAGHRAATR